MVDDIEKKEARPSVSDTEASGFIPVHMIPQDIIDDWAKLPYNTPINVTFTKFDLDMLFFAISNTQRSIDETNRSFIQWSNGNLAEAQRSLEGSRQGVAEAIGNLRKFFQSIVERMVRGEKIG